MTTAPLLAATLDEAARLLNISHSALSRRISQGEIPSFKTGRSRRILITDLVLVCQSMRRIPRGQEHDFDTQLEQSIKTAIIALREMQTAQKVKNRLRRQLNFHHHSNTPTLHPQPC
jgi:excisionase family DNA binding protein